MPDAKRLTRFLASLTPEDRVPQLVFELKDGSRFKFIATLEQIEDLADALDEVLDLSANAQQTSSPGRTAGGKKVTPS